MVILTADARNTERDRLMDDGADGYVAKPFDLTMLRKVITERVNRVPNRRRNAVDHHATGTAAAIGHRPAEATRARETQGAPETR